MPNAVNELQQIEASIAALEAHRTLLGDDVVDTATRPLRARLDTLRLRTAPASERLRQISALFCDIAGSTALTQRLDAEDAQAILGGALQRFAAVIEAHGSRVLRFMGDGLFAAFGIDGAREDDPEQAVRAGLALLAEAAAYAAELQRERGIDSFDIRVGIHTGTALLGGGVEAGNAVDGITVHLAARMEQTAPRGGLRISHDTWRQVRGLFDVAEQAPLQVKGHEAPLQTYLVERARPRGERQAHRGVVGVATRLIGREAELARLRQAFGDVRDGTRLQAITIVGDAGLGKTRLLAEFSAWARAHGASACEARASERRQSHPYGLLRDLFTARLNIPDSDPAPAATERWLGQVSAALGSEADAAVLGHVLGFDCASHPAVRNIVGEARQLRDRAFHYAARYFRQAAAAVPPPLLLLLDDLHWADDGSLEFIAHLQTTAADAPLLIIGLTRATLYERHPTWRELHERIELPQLGSDHSGELAEALLQRLPEVPEALRTLVTEGAQGNPFYIEERVNMLIDQGAITAGASGDDWQLRPERLAITRVPPTLTGVLQARLDALDADVRRTLQLAAIVGPVFWDQALAALDGGGSDTTLAALMAREMIVAREPSSLEGQREFAFRHHMLYQVSYDSVLKKVKRPAHAKVAAWLAAQPGSLHLDGVAEHYERGGEAAQAITYWHRAADAAMARYANAAAVAQADRALALLPDNDHERRYALVTLQVRVLNRQAERDREAQGLDEMERLAEALDDDAKRSEVAERRGRLLDDIGDSATALQMARRALEAAPSDQPTRSASAHLLAAASLRRLGDYVQAQHHATTGLRQAREAGDRIIEGMMLNQMGMAANDSGDPGSAMPFFEHAVALHRATLNRGNEAGTLANLAYARFVLGDYPAAQDQFAQALRLCQELGERHSEGIVQINLALVSLNRGEVDKAHGHAQLALSVIQVIGDRWAEAAARRVAGQAALARGQLLSANSDFTKSRDLFDEMDCGHLAIEAIAGLALTALAEMQVPVALAHVEEVLARQGAGAGLGGTDEPMRIYLSCYRVLHAAGDPRAESVLTTALTELEARAAKIKNPNWRHGFMSNVPCHRELLALRTQPVSSCC